MKVHLTVTGAKASGKSHLAAAFRRWLQEEYPVAAPLEVTIVERYPEDSPETLARGTYFQVLP